MGVNFFHAFVKSVKKKAWKRAFAFSRFFFQTFFFSLLKDDQESFFYSAIWELEIICSYTLSAINRLRITAPTTDCIWGNAEELYFTIYYDSRT